MKILRIIIIASIIAILLWKVLLAQAEGAEVEDSIESAIEELRAAMVQKSLQKLISSCENATASLLISKDPEQYQRDVFDVAYQVTNVISRRKPKSTDDIKWFEQKLPFCPFRLKSGAVEVISYKACGLGFVVLEGRVYKHGINTEDHSIIGGKVLRFR